MRLRLLPACMLLLLLLVGRPADASYLLTIFHNNDGESRLINAGTGSLPGGAQLQDFGGAARFVSLLNQRRSAAETTSDGVLTLSSGDNFLAGPEFNASLANGVFYDALVLRAIQYDAIVLGNHDFDFGPEVLSDFIDGYYAAGGTAKYLTANADFSGSPGLQSLVSAGKLAKSTVVTKGGEQIGIVGAITPQLKNISSPGPVVVDSNVAAAVQAEIDALTVSGVNKIVLVSHLQTISEDKSLIAQLRDVDIAIAGGGSDVLANSDNTLIPGDVPTSPYATVVADADGGNVPIVTTTGEYRYLGELNVRFDDAGKVIEFTQGPGEPGTLPGGPIRVVGQGTPSDTGDGVAPDAAVQAEAVDPVQQFVNELDSRVVSRNTVGLDGRRSAVRTRETNLGNLVADAFKWQATELANTFGVKTPDIAIQNGGGIRNNSILTGDLSELDTFSVLPFSNFVSVIEDVPLSVVLANLENAVSRVEFVDGRFAQISGFRFTYDPGQSPGQRIRDVYLEDGTPLVIKGVMVDPLRTLTVASIDFLFNGGDFYNWGRLDFTRLGVTYQQAFENYLRDGLGGSVPAGQYPVGGTGRITVVPEPSTLALLGLGALGLAFAGRRRSA